MSRRKPHIVGTTMVCERCGHAICPHCRDWCDTMLEDGLCCGGECEPVAIFFWVWEWGPFVSTTYPLQADHVDMDNDAP